jgi:hypothetical protein
MGVLPGVAVVSETDSSLAQKENMAATANAANEKMIFFM